MRASLLEFRQLRLNERVSIILQALQVVAIIAGGAWFIFEFRADVTNRAKEEALKYVAKSNDSSIADSIVMMRKPAENDALVEGLSSALRISYTAKDICPVDSFYQREMTRAYYSTLADKEQFHARMSQLIVFYTSLSICATSSACDLETTCVFFFSDIKEFVTRHCTYFDRRKLVQGQSPVREIERFLRECATMEKFKVPSLTYCEVIRDASGKSAKELYQSCASSTARQSAVGARLVESD